MKLLSGEVLGTAAVLAAPTLWQGFVTGAVPIDVALTRYLMVALIAWVALSAFVMMIGDAPRPAGAISTSTDDSASSQGNAAPPAA